MPAQRILRIHQTVRPTACIHTQSLATRGVRYRGHSLCFLLLFYRTQTSRIMLSKFLRQDHYVYPAAAFQPEGS